MKLISTFIFILITTCITAQSGLLIDELLKQKRSVVNRIDVSENSTTTVLLSSFSEGNIQRYPSLEDLTVLKVYYVYTRYHLSPNFNQIELDKERFNVLSARYPQLIGDPLIEWEIIEQTGCSSPTEGDDYFHGFIIIHRPKSESKDREEEIRKLAAFFDNPEMPFEEQKSDLIKEQVQAKDIKAEKNEVTDKPAMFKAGNYALYEYLHDNIYSGEAAEKRADLWIEVDVDIDEFGKVEGVNFKDPAVPDYAKDAISGALITMPDWDPAIENGKANASVVNLSIRVSYSRIVSGMYKRDGMNPKFTEDEITANVLAEKEKEISKEQAEAFQGSTVYRGMDLLSNSEKYALVMDVTGSMAPHIAALNRWMVSNPEGLNITSYSFYNDGDNKPTSAKKKGSTGGIYMTKNAGETKNLIQAVMKSGNGGEISEADIEPILFAIKNDTLCDAILLIADNYSPIRDFSLLEEVNKKVNVLLCSAPKAVREEYLTLVKVTGGVLLLNGRQIDLSTMSKGDVIALENSLYQYTGTGYKYKGTTEQEAPNVKGTSSFKLGKENAGGN